MTTYCSPRDVKLVPSESSRSTHEPRIRLSPVRVTVGKAAAWLVRAAVFSLLAGAGLAVAQTPFTGTPIAIPGTWEAENFDHGGEGVAYHDLTPGNQGGQYRTTEDVDIIVSQDPADAGTGYVVNNYQTGEWLGYTINVPTAGNYTLELRAVTNSGFPNTAYHLEIDGTAYSSIVLPTTDTVGWSNFQWIGAQTGFVAAGTHFLKVVSDQQYFNLNRIRILSAATPPANLLFQSGYEGTTAIAPVDSCFNGTSRFNGCWQSITGGDTGMTFTWPPIIWGSATQGAGGKFQLVMDAAGVDATPQNVPNYMVNSIETGTGRVHNGTPSQALLTKILQSGCCGTGSMGAGVTQDPYQVFPAISSPSAETDLYISYWIKFQPDLVQLMTNNQTPPPSNWRAFFEFKTGDPGLDDGDFRVLVELVTWGPNGPLSWYVFGDNQAGGPTSNPRRIYWEQYTTTTAATLSDWMKFEVFWHRSGSSIDNSGRVWVAVNGVPIADVSSATSGTLFSCALPCNTSMMGVSNLPINRIMVNQLYTSTSYPIYQWVDDVQIWRGFPTAAPGDPWYDPPYASH